MSLGNLFTMIGSSPLKMCARCGAVFSGRNPHKHNLGITQIPGFLFYLSTCFGKDLVLTRSENAVGTGKPVFLVLAYRR